eukprot:757919-Hanusia_phi.AAC.1
MREFALSLSLLLFLSAAIQPLASPGAWLACAECGKKITTATSMRPTHSPFAHESRLRQVDHRHQVQTQTLVNPRGISFEVLRTRMAANSLIYGRRVFLHSWYPGFAWQCVACKHCMTHLGWFFSAETGKEEADWSSNSSREEEEEQEKQEEQGAAQPQEKQQEVDGGIVIVDEANSHAPLQKEETPVVDFSHLPGVWLAETSAN